MSRLHRFLPRRRTEEGATAVFTAVLALLLVSMAALGVDIATQVNQRQELQSAIDGAVYAAAAELRSDDPVARPVAEAKRYVKANMPDLELSAVTVKVLCVLASVPGASPTGRVPDATRFGIDCDPRVGGVYDVAGTRCNDSICAIPCVASKGKDNCNTVKVAANKPVPFAFAPVMGVNSGWTGPVQAAACVGACGGGIGRKPLDMTFIGDRTGSMIAPRTTITQEQYCPGTYIFGLCFYGGGFKTLPPAEWPWRDVEVTDPNFNYAGPEAEAVRNMLTYLDRDYDRVAFSTIGPTLKSVKSSDCPVKPASTGEFGSSKGTWTPIPLNNDFQKPEKTDPRTLNPASSIVKSVDCFASTVGGTKDPSGATNPSTGTHLAAPLRETQRVMSLTTRPSTQRVIVLLTDGRPEEGSMSASPSSSNTRTACNNAVQVAQDVKDANTLVVTIAYRLNDTDKCSTSPNWPVNEMLAEMASPANGKPSESNGCNNTEKVEEENSDGDFFFCSSDGTDLKEILERIVVLVGGKTKRIKLP